MQYELSKEIWTSEDFDLMNWHDSHVHAISFGSEFKLLFDIDYIFKWVLKGKKYKFWVAPCTLIFENCYNVNFDLEMSTPEMDIDCISRENPQRPNNVEFIDKDVEFNWIIETQQGEIAFTSVGFKQYVRRKPMFISSQYFEIEERGGTSFDSTITSKQQLGII